MKLLLTIALLMLSFIGYTQTDNAGKVRQTIDSLNRAMENAFNENNMMKVAAFYADDAEIAAGGSYTVKERKNLDNYWLSLKDKGRGWKLEVIEVGGSGEFVYELGKSDLNYISGNNANPVSSVVNFIVIWKLQDDGTYKIFRDFITRTQFVKPGN